MIVKRKMQIFRQHAARLNRVRAHDLQQDTLNPQARFFKALRRAHQQILCDRREKVIHTLRIVLGRHHAPPNC
jgi:hypothetical protein